MSNKGNTQAVSQDVPQSSHAVTTAQPLTAAALAEMSHELRTPLNAIIGYADMIAQQRLGPDAGVRYQEYAEHIRTSGEHLRDIITALMDGLAPPETRPAAPLSLHAVAEQICQPLRQRAAAKDVRLATEIAGNPTVSSNPPSLRQALTNLMEQAIDRAPEGSCVSLTIAPDRSGQLFITISDAARGLRAANTPRLFDPYVRPQGQGERLGLSLVKALVEIHGGELTVVDDDDSGAAFKIALPPGGWAAANEESA